MSMVLPLRVALLIEICAWALPDTVLSMAVAVRLMLPDPVLMPLLTVMVSAPIVRFTPGRETLPVTVSQSLPPPPWIRTDSKFGEVDDRGADGDAGTRKG